MFTVRNPVRLLKEFRQSTLADGPQWLIDQRGGTKTAAGERISVDSSLAIADVFSAVNIITSDISQCPLKVYRDLDQSPSNSGRGVVDGSDHRAFRMLHDWPFPGIPAHRFWATIAGHELLWGNWYLEKLRNPETQLVEALRMADPASVDVEWNWQNGAKRFFITRPDGFRDGPFTENDVLHGFGYSKDGIVGMSPIQQARETLGTAKGRVRFEGDVYGQRPYISGVIEHPTTIKDGGVKLRESWRAVYGSGGPDRHGVAVLEEGASFTPITAPLADMQFVEAARMSKTEVATLFKLPASYLGGSTGDSLTYQTVESNRIQKATQAVAPVCNNIAQFLSHDFAIFPFQSWYCEFVLEGLMRGEPKARAEYLAAMKDIIGLKPEWIAARENIPADAIDKTKPKIPPQLVPQNGDGSSDTQDTIPVVNGNG